MLQAAIQAREKAASHGVDIGTLAIKEAARPQGIAVTLVGMRTPDEVRSIAFGHVRRLGYKEPSPPVTSGSRLLPTDEASRSSLILPTDCNARCPTPKSCQDAVCNTSCLQEGCVASSSTEVVL